MKTTRFEVTDYLDSEEAMEAFLTDAIEHGDESEVRDAEEVIARARIRWSLPEPSAAHSPHRRAG